MIKAAAAGVVVVAAALPVAAIAGTAGAATPPSLICASNQTSHNTSCYTNPINFGFAVVEQGQLNQTIDLYGTGFAYDNGPLSVTTTEPGVTVN